jgi:hypothetical protein
MLYFVFLSLACTMLTVGLAGVFSFVDQAYSARISVRVAAENSYGACAAASSAGSYGLCAAIILPSAAHQQAVSLQQRQLPIHELCFVATMHYVCHYACHCVCHV